MLGTALNVAGNGIFPIWRMTDPRKAVKIERCTTLLYFVIQTRRHGLTMANVRLSEDTRNRLEVLSKARDRTPHYLMKTAIERFLDVEEALEAEHRLVLGRWEKFELTGETVDHEEAKAWAASLRKSESESA